jgi:hypothetical protein
VRRIIRMQGVKESSIKKTPDYIQDALPVLKEDGAEGADTGCRERALESLAP